MENMYCRFCAEPKSVEGLLNLDCDDKKCREILLKLTFLNALYYIDITHRDNLPKTVCFICYESLNKAYDFLNKVRKAQEVITTLFLNSNCAKLDFSDDDRADLDEFFAESSDVTENADIKLETTISVKIEPKDEELPTNIFQDAVNSINCGANGTNNQDLNVHDFIDVALLKTPITDPVFKINKETKSWKEIKWACSDCGIEFFDVETLRAHCKAVHNKCAALSCTDCKGFTKNDDFKAFVKHVRKHRPSLWNVCHYCDETINTETLTAHLKHHVLNSGKACHPCGEIFQTEELFQQHLEGYIVGKPKRKPRRKAGQPITIEDLTCHICKKVYKNPNSLRDHLKRHLSDRKRNYTCDRCGKTFFSKGTLTSHVMAHDQIRPHVCKICNKSFQFPNMLRRHVEMHTGVKPYSCEVCGRSFRLQYQLNSHKIVHTDSMPYSCKYCHKAFRFKQILKSHERQHTGAKPYSCQHCFMDFSNWSNYNKHMRRRHNVETAKKKITPEGVFPINPETGQIVQINIQGMEEWKTKVMIPAKRGKKKIIKEESRT